jgi:hypothetical protein
MDVPVSLTGNSLGRCLAQIDIESERQKDDQSRSPNRCNNELALDCRNIRKRRRSWAGLQHPSRPHYCGKSDCRAGFLPFLIYIYLLSRLKGTARLDRLGLPPASIGLAAHDGRERRSLDRILGK